MNTSSNRQIWTFVGKALAIYGLWYIVYDLWLLPDGRLDEWLSHNVAWVTDVLMSAIGFDMYSAGRIVVPRGAGGVEIANGCNGLTTVGLFVGFVVAYPGAWLRRLVFIPLGILAIYATNVFRIVIMLLAQLYWPAAFDPLHGFGLTTIFYVAVFGLWVLWVNYGGSEEVDALPTDPAAATA
jgi:exosortase family protein XrtF